MLVAAAAVAGCGSGDSTDPAAVWDPCDLPAELITGAGFAAGSGRRDVAVEEGWAGCGWSSADAALRVWFAAEGSPDEVGGREDTHADITIGDRAGRRLYSGASDTAATCTVALPTAEGGVIRIRVDSAPVGTGPGACAQAERTAGALAPALPR